MFCLKCGMSVKTNKCEYCGLSAADGHENNYLKSPDIYNLLKKDEDFIYLENAETETEYTAEPDFDPIAMQTPRKKKNPPPPPQPPPEPKENIPHPPKSLPPPQQPPPPPPPPHPTINNDIKKSKIRPKAPLIILISVLGVLVLVFVLVICNIPHKKEDISGKPEIKRKTTSVTTTTETIQNNAQQQFTTVETTTATSEYATPTEATPQEPTPILIPNSEDDVTIQSEQIDYILNYIKDNIDPNPDPSPDGIIRKVYENEPEYSTFNIINTQFNGYEEHLLKCYTLNENNNITKYIYYLYSGDTSGKQFIVSNEKFEDSNNINLNEIYYIINNDYYIIDARKIPKPVDEAPAEPSTPEPAITNQSPDTPQYYPSNIAPNEETTEPEPTPEPEEENSAEAEIPDDVSQADIPNF